MKTLLTYRKPIVALFAIVFALVFYSVNSTHAQDYITGPWLWMIAPTTDGIDGSRTVHDDSLAAASDGGVTEECVAANGAKVGDSVGNYAWTLSTIRNTGIINTGCCQGSEIDNVTDVVQRVGWTEGNVDYHSSYALITLESVASQSNVLMRIGSDDAVKVWLNGTVVHTNPADRSSRGFQDEFRVNLIRGDNLLLVKVSEGWGNWSMFVGINANVNAVYKPSTQSCSPQSAVTPVAPSLTGPTTTTQITDPLSLSGDVNRDGIVNIMDLVLVASNFQQRGEHPADVNNDGVVNIVDLVLVAGAFGDAAAPSARYHNLDAMFTRAEIEHWLTQARSLNLTDTTSLYGMRFLEHLLMVLPPKETALLTNYPNPFNPETWIPYQLVEPAAVTLHIYAIDGKLVRTLSLGHQDVGTYQDRSRAAYWDGKNEVGEPVASGIYFYTLTAGDFTATRKMLIRK